MAKIEDYRVIPLRVTPEAVHCQQIYMREHFIRLMDPNKPKGRTLFLLNVPPYVTEQNIETFFNKVGEVVRVTFAAKPGRGETEKWTECCSKFSSAEPPYIFKVGYVIFKSNSSIAKALKINSIDLFSPTSGESFVESGMQLWHKMQENYILDEEQTQSQIDEFMKDYDTRERTAQESAKTSEADAEGWVTVGKHGRNAGFERKESNISKLETKLERSKKKELSNFYTFQIRESKMKNIIELRKKFEEDKKKIEILKKTRRFRPF